MTEKVMMFIDGSNLFLGCSDYKQGYKIDMIKLRDKLVGDRNLIRAYYYGAKPTKGDKKQIEKQMKFYHFLEHSGFKVTVLPLRSRKYKHKCTKCGYVQNIDKQIEKGVDVALVIDMLILGIPRYYDTAILVTGDLDFMRGIEELQRRGIKVEVAYFRKVGISEELVRCVDKFVDLEEIAKDLKRSD